MKVTDQTWKSRSP